MLLRIRRNRLIPGEAPEQYSGPTWAALVFVVTAIIGLVMIVALIPAAIFGDLVANRDWKLLVEATACLALIATALVRQIRLKRWACMISNLAAWWLAFMVLQDVGHIGWASVWPAMRDLAIMAVAPLMTAAILSGWEEMEPGF